MTKTKWIKEIYKDSSIDINHGQLTGRIYLEVYDTKKMQFGVINQRELEDGEIFWTRKLFITCEDFSRKGKLQTVEITLFADNPKSLKVSKGGIR